jgi:cobyrinic acid a,c-diamide synthase
MLAGVAPRALPPPARRIAIARDEAFSFLYPHILAG